MSEFDWGVDYSTWYILPTVRYIKRQDDWINHRVRPIKTLAIRFLCFGATLIWVCK